MALAESRNKIRASEEDMENAHQRFGVLEYTKRSKETTTRVRLRMDRFIGEVENKERGRAHLISVLGGDSDVGAVWAGINEQGSFTIEGPGIEPVMMIVGEGAQCFRGTIAVPGRKPIRHLVAISANVAKARPGADPGGKRTVLCDDDPVFVFYRIAQRFGLPVSPEWADWFDAELRRRHAIQPLLGVGCSPVLVTGTKRVFLKWIGSALRHKHIRFPELNGPIRWNVTHRFFGGAGEIEPPLAPPEATESASPQA
jgi:hypothetical protein